MIIDPCVLIFKTLSRKNSGNGSDDRANNELDMGGSD